MKIFNWKYFRSVAVFALIMAIAFFFHFKNMLHFPFFENDEGAYFAQAWSLISAGKLAPYTYWYDHAPFGWMFTALWILITNGLFTFGFSLNSARIFMLIIHLANTYLVYLLGRKILRSNMAILLATSLFSISPLAVYFNRRLLLDNLMLFWLLLSICFIYRSKKLRHTILSAIFFGLAVLTKENAIFFLPTLLYLASKEAHEKHRSIAIFKWLAISGFVISLYPLYALLKGELFPNGSIFSPAHPHVSLLETLKMQASRGTGLPFWNSQSDFMLNLEYWLKKDQLFVTLGYLSLLINGVLAFWNQDSRVIFFLTLPMVAFLSSGKLVINFYIVPLLPFFALSIGLIWRFVEDLLSKIGNWLVIIFCITTFLFLDAYYRPLVQEYLKRDETTQQVNAVNWIKQNVNPKSSMSIDFYAYLDLAKTPEPEKNFTNADWFWKVELDNEIKDGKLGGDFKNLDYIMMTAEVQRQLKGYPEESSILRQALKKSHQVANFSFYKDFIFEPDLYTQKYPNGDWVVIYKQSNINLNKVWETYKTKFVSPLGYVWVPDKKNEVISEAQAYALLRAVWMSDRETYDQILNWTVKNMKLKDSHLFGWKFDLATKTLVDQGNAPDADQDIALSLLFASKKWGDEKYKQTALKIISDLWKLNIYEDKDSAVLIAGNWANSENYLTLNPSYFAPYAYRIFAKADEDHNWNKVVETGYSLLNKCSEDSFDLSEVKFLAPEWCRYNKKDKTVTRSLSPQPESTDYAFNAFRVPWRVYLDYQWSNDPLAFEYLKKSNYLVNEYDKTKKLFDVYNHSGQPIGGGDKYGSVLNLPLFLYTNHPDTKKIYEKHLVETYTETSTDAYWLDGNEYYLQNWYWFVSGMYEGVLQDLYR